MLIRGKSHSRDESRNSRVSIKTLSFARIGTFTCVIGVGSPVGAREGGRSPARPSAVPGRICTAGPTQWHNYGYQLTAAETSVPSASYHVDTPLSFVSRRWRLCVWYAGHGRCEATSDRLIASAERQVTIIPLTIGLFLAVVSVSILVSREISFPRSKKIEAGGIMFSDCLSMCVRWASVHMSVDAWAQAFPTSSPLTYSF